MRDDREYVEEHDPEKILDDFMNACFRAAEADEYDEHHDEVAAARKALHDALNPSKEQTMEIAAQFKVHSCLETENEEKEYVLVPIGVEDVVDDLESMPNEEFRRIADEVEGFRFGQASTNRIGGRGALGAAGVTVRMREELNPGDRIALTISLAP